MANPVKFSKMTEAKKTPAPSFNEHTESILQEIGYGPQDIIKLKEQCTII